jgi:hypothetical protein
MKCTLMASIVFLNVNNKHKRIISANAHFKIKLQNTLFDVLLFTFNNTILGVKVHFIIY